MLTDVMYLFLFLAALGLVGEIIAYGIRKFDERT